jgi:NHLM bacteriocin system ABC transporter peptidase/ATP-binding protein
VDWNLSAPNSGDRWLPANVPRVNTPTVLQMEATECGAASLAIVLGFHGLWIPLEVLRSACGVSRDGSRASNMLAAARTYDMIAKGWRRTLDDLATVPPPYIVFWQFHHFLVVEGIDYRRERVWLNDPASGRRRVSLEEFRAGFSGICLTFEPGPNFHKGGQPPSLVRSVMPRLRGSKATLVYISLVSILLVVPGIAIPGFGKAFVDRVLITGNQSWLIPLAIGLAMTAVLRGALAWLQQIQLARLESKLALTQLSRFFWHVLRLDMSFYNQRHPGDISYRVMANDRLVALLSGELAVHAAGLLRIVFFAAVMFAYDASLAAVGVALSLLNLIALLFTARQNQDMSQSLARERGLLQATAVGGIALIETLKASGTEPDYFRRFTGQLAGYVNVQQALAVKSAFLQLLPSALDGLTKAAILGMGGLRVMHGGMTVGDVVAFQSLMTSFSEPVTGMVRFANQLQTAKGDIARLDDVAFYPPAPLLAGASAAHHETEHGKLAGAIEMRGVSFGYNHLGPALIHNLDLVIKPGQLVAIVGASGSGKSTAARLLTGLYHPWSGEVLYDALSLANISRQRFAASVSAVDQEIVLFGGTVRDNLTLWDPAIADFEIADALRDTDMLDTITRRPGGIDGTVLEAGKNYSGGQRQRLEIARALTARPSVLILDEATSALDTVAEAYILERIRMRGVTCVLIAHRLSTVRVCDQIIVLDQGRIVQHGTHDTLIQTDGPYRRLVTVEDDTRRYE